MTSAGANEVTDVLRMTISMTVLAAISTAATAAGRVVYEPKPGQGSGKHIVFLTGDEEYRSEEGLPMLAKILSQRHGFRCTVLFPMKADGSGIIDPDNQASLPNADDLDSADAIVMLLRYRQWPEKQMKHFAAAMRRGVPVIALRTSTHAFNYPDDAPDDLRAFNQFGKTVLGESWVDHWGRHKKEATRGVIEPGAENNPILRGVRNVFGDTDVYEAHPPGDATILLRGQVVAGMKPTDPPANYKRNRSTDKREQGINDPMIPVVWTRLHCNNVGIEQRVFCTTMGSATDLANEGLRRMIVNAVYWGLGLDVPASADVAVVDEYHPSEYGFGGYHRELKPGDFEIGKSLPASTK